MSKQKPAGNRRSFWAVVNAIVRKDLAIERHTRQSTSVMIIFAFTSVVVFNLALEGNYNAARDVATGLLWVTIVLAGTLGLNRALATEAENHSLDALLIAPVDRKAIYLGKVISVTMFMFTLEALLIPLFIIFFNKPLWRPQAIIIILLGSIGYVAAGVLVSAMTIQTRSRAVLLPVLLLPLTLPAVLAAASATAQYMLDQLPLWSEVQFAFSLVIAYDVLMLTAGLLTFQYVVEEG